MKRTILIYGLAIAAAASLLQWLEYRYAVLVFSSEIYIGAIAVLFTLLGIWVGNRLTRRSVPQETFEKNERAIQYGNPLFRLPMTFLEIFPVGLLISLISALVLRNTRLMPAVQPVKAHLST